MQYCLPCIPGFFQPHKGGNACQNCPPGKFQDSSGNETCQLLQAGTVVHIHGCLQATESMIMTTSQYLTHYENRFVQEFLGELFEKHTVLFVGYGLEEAEILEHILRRGKVSSQSVRQRFLLQGYYSDQENLFKWMQKYYQDSFGVHLQGFLLRFYQF